MGKYFGTDGFRGRANVDITALHAFKIGRFLGWYLTSRKGEKARIVIGKDTRRSSYMLEYALSSGITASGADAYLLHVTTTPSVAYITVTDGFDSGIMISASHNPYCDNGIKILNSKGEKQSDELLRLIEDYIDGKSEFCKENDLPLATDKSIGITFDYSEGRNRYIAYLISIAT
ncbi:MAG: phosphoglucosamine mutase, partial [Clostridia bacterium]|nr:phosphoglucosamine mutase [Clostridia bacterium]